MSAWHRSQEHATLALSGSAAYPLVPLNGNKKRSGVRSSGTEYCVIVCADPDA